MKNKLKHNNVTLNADEHVFKNKFGIKTNQSLDNITKQLKPVNKESLLNNR